MANFPSIDRSSDVGGGAENYKGQYASLKFPKFVYQEYPKHVKNASGTLLGVANNALEEAEILGQHGLEHKDVDSLAHAMSENEALKAKLAQYEGGAGVPQIAAQPRKSTTTVEMLPQEHGSVVPQHEETSPEGANPTYNPPLGGDPATTRPAVKPAGSPQVENQQGNQTVVPASVSGNPLLRDKVAPVANAAGKAPQINKTVDPGV